MERTFDSVEYIVQVGQDLVADFERARLATTSGLIGSAKEIPVRDRLESILPNGLAVGTGCVIDCLGSASRQMDVVLYEKEICPTFRLNNDDSATYFPCEGVVAVGEIKSTLSTIELKDIFSKLSSAKRLERFVSPLTNPTPHLNELEIATPFRQYGSKTSFQGSKEEEYNQSEKPLDQIYGFALTGSLSLRPETLCTKFVELEMDTGSEFSPNLIVALDGGVLCPLGIPPDKHNPEIMLSTQEASSIYCVTNADSSFQFLLSRLQTVYQKGRSVEMSAFNQYFTRDGKLTLPSTGKVFELHKRK